MQVAQKVHLLKKTHIRKVISDSCFWLPGKIWEGVSTIYYVLGPQVKIKREINSKIQLYPYIQLMETSSKSLK